MKPVDRHLHRLFKAARAVPRLVPTEVPPALRRRILTRAWSRVEAIDEWLAFLPLVRRALVGACLIALAAAAFGYFDRDAGLPEEAALLQSQVRLEDLP